MISIIQSLFTALVFSLSCLVALRGGTITRRGKSYATALAAAILLVLSVGSLFPESLKLIPDIAAAGFLGGFALLFLAETFTRAHTYHSPGEHTHQHDVTPFVVGLAVHNFADGFSIGVSSQVTIATSWALGLGILVHQLPVGFSMAAIFINAHATRTQIMRAAVLLGLMIPLAAILTVTLPALVEQYKGLLLSISAGVLAYMATSHLLPEAQAEHPSRTTGIVFILGLLAMTISVLTFLAE